MKVLFLDIDSVLNVSEFGDDLYDSGKSCFKFVEDGVPLNVECIDALKYIFSKVPDLKVVWSSDWRLYDEPTYKGFKNPRLWLEAQAWMEGRVIGKTPKKMSSTHYEEIRMWLSYDERSREVEKFAILDDYTSSMMCSYFKDSFFQCMYDVGLTMETAERVVKHFEGQDKTMQFGRQFAMSVTGLKGRDSKMLLINNRFYCELSTSCKARESEPDSCFFSEAWHDSDCPTMTQFAFCYVLDVSLEKGHHKPQFGTLYHTVHFDLEGQHTFSLMLREDNTQASVSSVKVFDKPYPLSSMLELIDADLIPDGFKPEDCDLMKTLDGVANIDLGSYGRKSASLEYYMSGQLYAEIVDFSDVPEGGIVALDDAKRRDVIVNMLASGERLSEANAADVAALISAKLRAVKNAHEAN